ncbi:MAG: UDP-N-acetylmuramoyl-L-alanyl-D-glutamate--2,6-diaminopimelate ligase [Minisyncoccota bacterium]
MKHALSRLLPKQIKNIAHLIQAILACVYFGFPARKLTVIGVTGTNGKTTTTQFIARILERAGKSIAMASTIQFQINDKQWVNTSKFTTLSSWKLQRFLAQAVQAKCEYAVIETSSHALDQHRVWGIPYAIAVMTNVTREHLDYHETMEKYRLAKRRLFTQATRAVINRDMEEPEFFIEACRRPPLLYGIKNHQAQLLAENIEMHFQRTEFRVQGVMFHLNVPGVFNIENALASLGVAQILGIDFALAQEALASILGIPGRMELVPNTLGADILIDYAVTPDAFEKLYASILPLKIPGTKIIHVFGACGERDRGKRPLLGAIASHYADNIILTNEDPYYENPEQILDDIEVGITKKAKDYSRIFDRRQAIQHALSLAEIGDIVLITGKGAETTIADKGKRLPWNERDVVEKALRNITQT